MQRQDTSAVPGRLDRRRMLQCLAAGAAASSARLPCFAAAEERPLIIDCHAHIYGDDETRYPTIDKPYRPPPGKGTISHLRREMHGAGVRYVTAVQTSTYYRWDNRFTADSAREHREFMVGICTLDPDDAGSAATLEKYVRDYNVRGMRSIPAQSGRLDDPGVARLWQAAEKLGIVINVLVNRDMRGQIEELSARCPKLRIVIDHCLNLKAGPDLEPTLADMVALAALPNAHAKLSFIPTGSAEEYPCRDMHEPCRKVLEAFGPDRCVWGSDFPCELWCPKVSYAQHLKIFTHELGWDESVKKAVLVDTPQRLWIQPLAT